MKTTTLGIRLLVVGILLSVCGFAHAQKGRDGGGGDREALEFARHMTLLIHHYSTLCESQKALPPGIRCDAIGRLTAASLRARVMFDENVFGTDGRPRDAVNNGTDLITVGRVRWRAMLSENVYERVLIAAHEYAVIAGLESADAYGFSDMFTQTVREDKDIEAVVDYVRFPTEYLLKLSDLQLAKFILGFELDRSSRLFGRCGIGIEDSQYPYVIVLEDQALARVSRIQTAGAEIRKLLMAGVCK